MDEEPQDVVDYLGQPSPVSLSGRPALPVGGAPFAPSAGPQLPGGGGLAEGPPQEIPAPFSDIVPGSPLGGLDPVAGGPDSPESESPLIPGLQLGGRLIDILRRIFGSSGAAAGSFARAPGLEEAWQAYRAGERGDFGGDFGGEGGFGSLGGVDSFGGIDPFGGVGVGEGAGLAADVGAEAASVGAEVGAEMAGELASMGDASGIFAIMKAAVDFMAEGTIPGEGIIDAIWPGTIGDSEAWMSYGSRLGGSLSSWERANQEMALALASAKGAPEIESIVADWRGKIGQNAGGFGQGAGPLEISDLPGVTGSRHEGRISGGWGGPDIFAPEIAGLREMLNSAMAGGTQEERILALMRTMETRRGEMDVQGNALRDRVMADNAAASEWQASQQNQGSA